MGRSRKQRQSSQHRSSQHQPLTPHSIHTSTGEVELREDPFQPGAWEVLVNGVPSSHIHPDPLQLEFEYMRWMAEMLAWFESTAVAQSQLRITHLGGGACSLARYCCARWPKARNTVIELDEELTRLVRQWFDLPRAPQLKIRAAEARASVEAFQPHSRDVIIRDVFSGNRTPQRCSSLEFMQACARSLAPGGLYLANCGDHRDLQLARSELRSMQEVFAHTACIADPAMLKGRRYGNIVLIGSDRPLPEGTALQQMQRNLLAGAVPAQYKAEQWTGDFSSAGSVLHDPADEAQPL
ncbi:spermidine synthase [Corynebacterium pseudopelargi]|uniref:Spermidine synthase n=1 Tax=Corynebacterium pseudopelargi TaxID=2080757 RepID=A0A3G6IUM1_9CORY|nr:fused MFS/spermidine synthase [Corynebacterium pseudopelargi]AZA09451.1 spermidine synthase [Corynebacterium pseudopelargi]